ncbi:MAG: hypothetical protein ACRC68_05000, partial [Clostridium sp.]
EIKENNEGDFKIWKEKYGLIHEGYIVCIPKSCTNSLEKLYKFSQSIGDDIKDITEKEGYVFIEYISRLADTLFKVTDVYKKLNEIEEDIKKIAKNFDIYQVDIINHMYLDTYAGDCLDELWKAQQDNIDKVG